MISKVNNDIKRFIHIVSIILAIAGLCIFGYKAYTDFEHLHKGIYSIINNPIILFVELLLLLLNVFLESQKWYILDRYRSKNSYIENILTILESIALSSSTPGGVGEHIAKLRRSNDMFGSAIASLLGSFIQTAIITIMGIIGLTLSNKNGWLIDKITLYISAIVLFISIIYIFKNRLTSKIKDITLSYSIYDIIKITILNILRYFVFTYQLYLLFTLNIFHFDLSLISNIMVYYLIVTIIPSVGLADIGIRGSVAIFVFGNTYFSQWTGIPIIMIWLINRVLPSVIGFVCICKRH